ncbi:MAG: short-chain dehydrogenase [Flammeovirgaceae bacterium]|nr:short-chain dehydrogenase [Flammeovirgaceae bacterium]HCX23437.1 short-chain dehydrogenase [Cytophagales bacterium]|tara:strand:+ start:1037 stop:1816 length:780 start_codon:yes stop_codon:yes gene_type:complete
MSKKFDLTGKTAVITGGGSGIGRAIAIALAESGALSIILDLNLDGAQEVVEEIKTNKGLAEAYSCNVASFDDVQRVFVEALKDRQLDILVNNAGIAHVGNILNTSPDDFERIYNVNIKGVYNSLKAGVEAMKNAGGSIINLSSVAAHVGISDRFAYSTSKGAVHAMTLSVAKDCLSYGIRCNSISPGRVHTPFVDGFLAKNYPGNEKEMFETLSKTQPIGRMGKPDEMGSLVLYLCSEEASFITGSDFKIDGGFVTLNT